MPDVPTAPADDRGPATVVLPLRVERVDVDAGGTCGLRTVSRWAELGEAELHRRLGTIEYVFGRTPRVHLEMDFTRPLVFDDTVSVEFGVASVGTSSLRYAIRAAHEGVTAAAGVLVVVHTDEANAKPEPWPDAYRSLFMTAGPQ